jgi:hypothetical protein
MLPRFFGPRVLTCASVLAITCLASSASAQVESTPEFTPAPPPPPAPAPEPEPEAAPAPARAPVAKAARETEWYGWQTLTADGLSVATIIAGAGLKSSEVALLGVGGYFVAAPIVHVVQGRVGVAFGSFGLRVAAPMVGGAIGYMAAGPCSASESGKLFGCLFHGWAEAAVGGLIGATSAVALDAALLAHKTREATPPPQESGTPKLTSIAPSFDPRTRTTTLGASGTF